MEGHSGQKCNLIATRIPLDRIRVPLDRTSIPLDRTFLAFDRTFIPLDRAFLPFDRTSIILSLAILHWFVPLWHFTFIHTSVAFHIYPYLCGNSIPSDRNYRSAVVTIWSAVKRRRLNLHSGQTFKSITAVADLQKLPTSLSLGTTY